MAVREAVFVQEQGVALERELDADDGRAYHWVAYASVSRRSSSDANTNATDRKSSSSNSNSNPLYASGHRESDTSTAMRVPAGTIRLLPPLDPHTSSHTAQIAPHPSASVLAGTSPSSPSSPSGGSAPPESYILLGRLSVASAYRGLGLGRLLVNAALDWARLHGEAAFMPALSPAELEAWKLDRRPGDEEGGAVWKGLVVVHSQKGHAEKVWARMGFVKDEGMGEWVEEGIDHVGMWKRLELPGVAPLPLGH
jgi:predicted GNAT family N-acyltransferase